MKVLVLIIFCSFLLNNCQPSTLDAPTKIFENVQTVKSDTIIFTGYPKNTYSEVFNWELRDANNKYLGAFKEDSVYYVTISSKQDLKFNLVPLTKNLTIKSNMDSYNEFWIKTRKLNPDSTFEKAIIEIKFDTVFNKPVIFRKDLIKDSITNNLKPINYQLNWDGLGTVEMKIKRN